MYLQDAEDSHGTGERFERQTESAFQKNRPRPGSDPLLDRLVKDEGFPGNRDFRRSRFRQKERVFLQRLVTGRQIGARKKKDPVVGPVKQLKISISSPKN